MVSQSDNAADDRLIHCRRSCSGRINVSKWAGNRSALGPDSRQPCFDITVQSRMARLEMFNGRKGCYKKIVIIHFNDYCHAHTTDKLFSVGRKKDHVEVSVELRMRNFTLIFQTLLWEIVSSYTRVAGKRLHTLVLVPTRTYYVSITPRLRLKITTASCYITNNSIFPPKIWAKQSSDRIHTTNACESFHSNFNSNFYHQHPHIFKIIEILKLFQNKGLKLKIGIEANLIILDFHV
ncbi:hypothetical protein AGLY_009158 [Aphis glycines]|uniref:Uncharacterized protein n=1 Tax=Aphis glycines TaxID=307491 RepID=A0A6G0TKR5_APHGL|nr:hypothetical protein AGLY_009158 [Aphis glycines]